MKGLPLLLAGAMASGWGLSAHAQLLSNGDFETPPYSTIGTVAGWTVGGNVADTEEGATNGTHSAAFSAGGDSEGDMITQSFPTTVGQMYTLDFDAAVFGVPDTGSNLRLRVQVFGSNPIVDETITPIPSFGYDPNSVPWQHYQYTFMATSTTATLQFSNIGLGNAVADQVVDSVVILPELKLTAAASVKTHGSPGTAYSVNLPLTGNPGVECRLAGAGDAHTLVFTFSNNVDSGSATVTDGAGSAGTATFANKTMTVELTGVTDEQKITVTLSGVTDEFGQVLPNTPVEMGVLLGDTTEDESVNSGDISQTKSQSGTVVSGTNFREDVTLDNAINSGDISLVKSRSGNGILAPALPTFDMPEPAKKFDTRKLQRGGYR